MCETEQRQSIIDACRKMETAGLNQGTSGNISLRHGSDMLITPSSTPYDAMQPEMIVTMPLAGAVSDTAGAWSGPLKPSSEWRFHRDILRARPEIGAVVHAHSPYCTALAITRRAIPACHYMIAAFGGTDVRCSPYATFGTPELSAYAVQALEGRTACLLANHGMIVCAPALPRAMWLAVELETIARQYVQSLLIGGPIILTDAEIAEAAAKFATYGAR